MSQGTRHSSIRHERLVGQVKSALCQTTDLRRHHIQRSPREYECGNWFLLPNIYPCCTYILS